MAAPREQASQKCQPAELSYRTGCQSCQSSLSSSVGIKLCVAYPCLDVQKAGLEQVSGVFRRKKHRDVQETESVCVCVGEVDRSFGCSMEEKYPVALGLLIAHSGRSIMLWEISAASRPGQTGVGSLVGVRGTCIESVSPCSSRRHCATPLRALSQSGHHCSGTSIFKLIICIEFFFIPNLGITNDATPMPSL